MRITIASPERPGATSGNNVTSSRWARRITELGHDVETVAVEGADRFDAEVRSAACTSCDVVIALHARRCAGVVGTMGRRAPDVPVIVGLAGTDLYADLPGDPDARRAIDAAHRLIVLQPAALDRLADFANGPVLAAKARVVHQSVEPPLPPRRVDPDRFVVAVLAHLRDVKDPMLTAAAVRRLSPASRVMVVHAGAAHDETWRTRADAETVANPRYQWRGEVGRDEALDILASARLLAITSRLEGGANVVTEAIALGVAVIGTRVDGTTGLLGADHPGLVPVGDAEALASVIRRCEADPAFLAELTQRSVARQHLTDVRHEREQWRAVLDQL